jgi:phage FluMu protein Com
MSTKKVRNLRCKKCKGILELRLMSSKGLWLWCAKCKDHIIIPDEKEKKNDNN